METRANYVLIGIFTLAVIAGAFGFVWWFERASDKGARVSYEIVFDGSVSGLRPGSAVLFNGIRVGEVTSMSLDQNDPSRVITKVGVSPQTPVRADTRAGLEYQGLRVLRRLHSPVVNKALRPSLPNPVSCRA